ncbi:MAG: hypothetical protein U9R26_10000, partial [Campylobacterota bacterium]|nr:hypothetical protein [Campylobacterota bacterium]
ILSSHLFTANHYKHRCISTYCLLQSLKKLVLWYNLNIATTKRDLEVFIADKRILYTWSRDFFMDIVRQIKYQREKA